MAKRVTAVKFEVIEPELPAPQAFAEDEADAAGPLPPPDRPAPDAEIGKVRSRGLRFPDDSSVLTPRLRRLLRSRRYEAGEANAVRALVGPDDVALELGAGIGFMSTLMAKSCKAREVHSFEANPRLIRYIRQVHALNGVSQVKLTNALLGARKGKATFYERDDLLASSLDPDPPGVGAAVIATHEVEVLNIKTVMRAIKPTALICDIEGAEATLLPLADLSTVRVAVLELHPQWIGKDGVQAVFDAFHKHGLTFYPKLSEKKVVAFRRDW